MNSQIQPPGLHFFSIIGGDYTWRERIILVLYFSNLHRPYAWHQEYITKEEHVLAYGGAWHTCVKTCSKWFHSNRNWLQSNRFWFKVWQSKLNAKLATIFGWYSTVFASSETSFACSATSFSCKTCNHFWLQNFEPKTVALLTVSTPCKILECSSKLKPLGWRH